MQFQQFSFFPNDRHKPCIEDLTSAYTTTTTTSAYLYWILQIIIFFIVNSKSLILSVHNEAVRNRKEVLLIKHIV